MPFHYLLNFFFPFLMLTFAAAADPVAAIASPGEASSSGDAETQPGETAQPEEATSAGAEANASGQPEPEREMDDPAAPPEARIDARGLPLKVKELMSALQESDPKAHGWLKDRLFREKIFSEKVPGGIKELEGILATVGAIKELVPPSLRMGSATDALQALKTELTEWRSVDSLLAQGSPDVLKTIAQEFPEGYKKLLPAALREYAQQDLDGYRRDMAGIISSELAQLNVLNRLGFVSRLLAKGDSEGVKEEIAAIAKDLEQYGAIAAEKPKLETKPAGRDLTKDLEEREFRLWVEETARPINQAKSLAIKNELKQYLKGQELDDETYEAIEAQALRYLDALLKSDPGFAPTFNSFVENRDREGMTRYMQTRLKELLPSRNGKTGPVERAFKLFFRNVAPKSVTRLAQKPAAAAKPAAKGWEKIDPAKAPQPHEIDRDKTPWEMRFAKAAILKDGRKVYWGSAAPGV
jgi:hypothetical protein